MSYNIVYDPDKRSKYPVHKKPPDIQSWLLSVMLFCLIVVMCMHPAVKPVLKEFFIPGDTEVTVQATQNLVDNIQAGGALSDALATFCIEVINGSEEIS